MPTNDIVVQKRSDDYHASLADNPKVGECGKTIGEKGVMRQEFGFERTSCACKDCAVNCRYMPGYLIPADLERMIPAGANPFNWADKNLLASPGALVMKDGVAFRIPTLVPAVKKDGSCINLKDGLCTIHEVSPFGCAFFDCGPERGDLSREGLKVVMVAWRDDWSLYARLWKYLSTQKRTQKRPDELRAKMAQEYK